MAGCKYWGLTAELFLQRLAGEVIQRKRQQTKGQHADIVVIEECVGQVEQVAVVEVGGFDGLEGNAEQADDAAGGDKSGGEQGAGGDLAFGFGGVAAGFFYGLIDEPADHAANEDGQSGADGQIGAHGECERADAEQLNGNDEGNAEHHQAPGEFAAQDAVDDGGHQPGLGRRGAGAADSLNPMNLDAAGRGGVEIFAVLQLG